MAQIVWCPQSNPLRNCTLIHSEIAPQKWRPPKRAPKFRLRRYTEVLSPLAGSKGGNMQFELSAPRVITFAISLVLALIAAVTHYAHIELPFSRTGFTLLLVGYLVLAAGNVLRNV
jgi:hypothetical protein